MTRITTVLLLVLAPLSAVALGACDKDGASQDPGPPGPAPKPSATSTTPPTSSDSTADAGRPSNSDAGGYYPGKSTKPM